MTNTIIIELADGILRVRIEGLRREACAGFLALLTFNPLPPHFERNQP